MKNPMQPIVDVQGVIRFKENAIVNHLLEHGQKTGCDMNSLAQTEDFSRDDWTQFAQLIGYSLSGFSELSYVNADDAAIAEKMHKDGLSEEQAKIQHLEAEIKHLRDALREPVARLFGIHPDDLFGIHPDDLDENIR